MLISAIKRFFHPIYRKFFQAVLFDNNDRREFLHILHTQLSFKLSLGQIFQNMEATGSTPQIKKLAKQSARDLTIFNDCTRSWEDYFLNKEVLLLRGALRQDNFIRGIELILESDQDDLSFIDAVIKANSQYLLFFIGFLVILIILGTQRSMLESFNPDMLLFFYLDWLFQWGYMVLVISILVYFIYQFYRPRLLGKPRTLMHKMGIYLAYDRQVAYQFCKLASDGLRSGLDMTEVIRTANEIFTDRRQRYGLFASLQRLTDGFTVASALKDTLFEPNYSDYLAAFAPSEGREQLAVAFEKVAKLLNNSVARQFRQLRYHLMSTLLLLGFLMFYPILQLMTGAAMQSSM